MEHEQCMAGKHGQLSSFSAQVSAKAESQSQQTQRRCSSAPGLIRLLLAGTQKPAPGTQEREAAREGPPGLEVPGFYHTWMARSGLYPGPPQSCMEQPGGLESSSWLMDMQGGVILLGQGASGDSKGGGKDLSTNSMKLQRLSQSKKLHQAKLENF